MQLFDWVFGREAHICVGRTVAMVQKRLSVRGWAVGHPKDCEDTLAFAQTHGIKPMVEKFPLEKAREAYDRRGSARFRAVIVPGLE